MQVLASTPYSLLSFLEDDLSQQDLPSKQGLLPLEEDIFECLNRFTNDRTVTKPLCRDDIDLIGRQYKVVNEFCQKNQRLSFEELMHQAHHLRMRAKENPLSADERLQLIAIGRLAIRLHFDIYPYNTQILGLLGVFIGGEKRQAQIKTGEGKSIIIALWAFVMAMECRSVDIITSARYLAVRDQQKFASFFTQCNITSSHICYDEKKPSHFKAQILYGPVFDFEFAWMEDQLNGTNLYAERMKMPYVFRNFDAVCVDESDNLLIDTAANGARLSTPTEECYHWIYGPILSYVNSNFNETDANPALRETIPHIRDFIGKKVPQSQQEQYQQLSNKQIFDWVSAAHIALFKQKENRNYIVRPPKNKGGKTEEAEIKIIDIQTGRISEKSRWQKGVHQFLELKHDITIKKESLVPISLSHAVFYQMYQTITALTGTAEHAQTAQIYNLTTFHVPPHLPVQRKDLPTIFTETTEEHYSLILDNARNYLKLGRPLLILCETIQDSQDLTQLLELHKIDSQLLNEIQEEQEELVVTRASLPGQITVATNTAGRGTDIILNFESLQNGGLHVLLTFYPDSEREKWQAIGRAGRQGQPGSSQMIINKESPKLKKILSSSDSRIDDLLLSYWKERDAQQIKEHLSRAILERFLSEKTSIFFDAFRLWKTLVNQNTFLDRESMRLYKLKIAPDKEKEDPSHPLSKRECLLAKEYKELLFSNESSWMHWKAFLKRVIVQLDHKIMKEWSLQFFQPITEEIMTPNKEEALIKTEIEEKFDNHRPNWEKYLTPDGQGIFVYLEELTGFKI